MSREDVKSIEINFYGDITILIYQFINLLN